MAGNIITVEFDGNTSVVLSDTVYQYDYGQKLYFADLTLPEYFEVHFSNVKDGKAGTMIGHDQYVDIPDKYLISGSPVYGWLFFHETEYDGETEYTFRLPIVRRARPVDVVTPEQESVITQAIAALNSAIEDCDGFAEDSEAWAVGQRDGVDVDSDDDTYNNNSKYYAGQASGSAATASTKASEASGSANSASGSANTASNKALVAEGYADGKQNGEDVASGSPYYHNNSKYYSERSENAASSVIEQANTSEAYAVGKRDGVDVGSSDPAYHNNSKYYATAAGDSAAAAAGSANTASDKAGEASGSATIADNKATEASGYAGSANANALKSEGFAVGQQNGDDVSSGSDYFHNNAKYYKEQAAASAANAGASETNAGNSETAASGSASAASASALASEGYATGKQNGTDVASGSPYYENNAKFFKEQAENLVGDLATEATLSEIKSGTNDAVSLLQQIVEEGGHSGDLNGFSLNLGVDDELLITYTDPEDETDTVTITAPTNTTMSAIVTVLEELADVWKGAIEANE